jgi:recombination protein RecR
MKKWPSNLQTLITHFGRLPGVGPKMAERIVLSLLKKHKEDIHSFSHALSSITEGTLLCTTCFTLSANDPCEVCGDSSRDTTLLLVTADPVSTLTIEQSGTYNGLYFILGGLINPIEGITPEKLRVKKLVDSIEKRSNLKEVIFAFNPNVEGEATLLYLKKLLSSQEELSFSRLARGIPVGADLTYADDITIASAVNQRQKL